MLFHMAQKTTSDQRLAAVIEGHRLDSKRTYRGLADETLIPLTTLHRNLQSDEGAFTVTQLRRIALAFDVTVSELMAEAEKTA